MRWLVDGMNVIGTRPDAWWKDRDAAMVRLVDRLERWVAASGEDVTVVFERPPSPPRRARRRWRRRRSFATRSQVARRPCG